MNCCGILNYNKNGRIFFKINCTVYVSLSAAVIKTKIKYQTLIHSQMYLFIFSFLNEMFHSNCYADNIICNDVTHIFSLVVSDCWTPLYCKGHIIHQHRHQADS